MIWSIGKPPSLLISVSTIWSMGGRCLTLPPSLRVEDVDVNVLEDELVDEDAASGGGWGWLVFFGLFGCRRLEIFHDLCPIAFGAGRGIEF